jgi:hypothetical protein
VAREFNVLALIKGEERYIFVYDETSRDALLNAFRDQAADPRLSLTWFDAAVLTEKARDQANAAHVAHDAHDEQETADAPVAQDDNDQPDSDDRPKARF